MAAKKTVDLHAAKQKRQKKIVIAGAVLLAVVLAIQVPRTLKMLDSGEQAAPATAPATQAPAGESASPGTDAAVPAAVPVAQKNVTDSDQPPAPDEGDLSSLERFSSKDPFVPQIVEPSSAPAAAPAGGSGGPISSTEIAPSPGGTTLDASIPSSGSGESAQRTLAVSGTSAVISVNGVSETVAVANAFPHAEPTFRLVQVGANAVKIAIAGGTYASGAQTITLKKGKRVTLMNTSDGTRYELRLVSVG